MRKPLPAQLILGFTFLLFTAILLFFLPNDFWQDEVYTLAHFVFISLTSTLTDYHSTNNHVLFSFLAGTVCHLAGYDLQAVMLHPYLLRCIPVLISIVSVWLFYTQTKRAYNTNTAIACSSIWLTTFPLLCFASQFRGYSLAILIVMLQYFSFVAALKTNRVSISKWLCLFLYTSLSLLCLPTNIYIEASYLLLCLFLFIKPGASVYLINTPVKRKNLVAIAIAVAAGCLCTGLYYRWMLQQQPPNELIDTFTPFVAANLLQSLAVFYHFTGYRFYLYALLAAAMVLLLAKARKGKPFYSELWLPLFLFFVPFLFFFVHGVIIIQRTFLPLIPFFALLAGLSLSSLSNYAFYNRLYKAVLLLNAACLLISFALFVASSKRDNVEENHQQDLTQHYYLIHFNELQAALLAKREQEKNGTTLYLRDGFGQTGIDYYLNELKVPYKLYDDSLPLPGACLILTNLKEETSRRLQNSKIQYEKRLNSDEQYNLFICGSATSEEEQKPKH